MPLEQFLIRCLFIYNANFVIYFPLRRKLMISRDYHLQQIQLKDSEFEHYPKYDEKKIQFPTKKAVACTVKENAASVVQMACTKCYCRPDKA